MKQLQPISIVAPGFSGLNTQDSGVTLSSDFAQVIDNCVIDRYGRLGARKGWEMKTTSGSSELSGSYVQFLMEHINADDTTVVLSGGNNKIFTGGANDNALTNITPAGYSITNNNWRGASLFDHALIVQDGHEPLVYSEGAATTFQTITDYLDTEKGITATQSYGTNYPHDVLAAYGRFWTHDENTVYWSTDIADTTFPAFSGGTSGLLNIAAIVPSNTDNIKAIAAHNNFLIIFCQHNIVIYKGADNPLGDFSLSDVIVGVGCIARDSVQSTGTDILFLSDTGVRSLGRVIQEKSAPMRDLTKNVRDDLVSDISLTRLSDSGFKDVKAVYSEVNAFYLLSFPLSSRVYCLDMRQPLQDGSARVTTWNAFKATAFVRRQNRDLLIGKPNGIGLYKGYQDNGATYRMRYYSQYLDMQSPTTIKILKQIKSTVIGGGNQVFVIKTGFDFGTAYDSYAFTLGDSNYAEYGVAEYGISEYSKGIEIDTIKSSAGGSGNIIQIAFEADIDGKQLSVQKIDIFVKTGRTE